MSQQQPEKPPPPTCFRCRQPIEDGAVKFGIGVYHGACAEAYRKEVFGGEPLTNYLQDLPSTASQIPPGLESLGD